MIRTAILQTALLSALVICSTSAAAKVEVQAVPHKSLGWILAARVSEDIAPGDYEALLNGIKSNPGKYARKIVLLDNIGGSVPEAIRMGRLLRETGFDAVVPAGGVCQGTCIYLLAAGHGKKVRGYVGLHRPYYPNGDSAQAQSAHSVNVSPMAYFKEMNVPTSLVEDMNRIAPSKMRVLSPQELAQYRLHQEKP
jgi:hypothetical protein